MNNETLTQAASRIIKEQLDLQNKNWYSVGTPGENNLKVFFYTNNTPTGKSSGILISLSKGEKGTPIGIHSERRCFDLSKLLSIDAFIQDSDLTADDMYDFLNNVLQICKKNGQK